MMTIKKANKKYFDNGYYFEKEYDKYVVKDYEYGRIIKSANRLYKLIEEVENLVMYHEMQLGWAEEQEEAGQQLIKQGYYV